MDKLEYTLEINYLQHKSTNNGKLTKTYIDEALDIIINNQITGLPLETSEKMFLMPLYNKLKELVK